MRSAEVAEQAGVNVQTLRYYERRGLLPAPERLASGYRAYDAEAVHIVRFVRQAQGLGFSLEEIGPLLDLAGGGPENCDVAGRLARDKVAQLDEKIAHLAAMRAALLRLVATCDLPRGRRQCPMLHAMETDAEQAGAGDG